VGCSPAAYPAEVRAHTALHVVKGAVVRVLGEGFEWTASTYVRGAHGRLVVTAPRRPSGEELAEVERLANQAVEWDLPVVVEELPRREAEEKYGRIIYDLFPVPEHVDTLKIVLIRAPDGGLWNINACNKEHTPSTGCIGRIRLGKPRYRASKKLLELPFDVEPP